MSRRVGKRALRFSFLAHTLSPACPPSLSFRMILYRAFLCALRQAQGTKKLLCENLMKIRRVGKRALRFSFLAHTLSPACPPSLSFRMILYRAFLCALRQAQGTKKLLCENLMKINSLRYRPIFQCQIRHFAKIFPITSHENTFDRQNN